MSRIRDGWVEYLTPKVPLRKRHPMMSFYTLLPGDLMYRDHDGTWVKCAPGLQVMGFSVEDDELRPIRARWVGKLEYELFDPATAQVLMQADITDRKEG